MEIHVHALAHNEAALLPFFFRHYDQFVSRYFIWEDESTDGTRAMLESHPNVTVMDVDVHGVDDGYWQRTIYPQYRRLSARADWVMWVDIDEVLYHMHIVDALTLARNDGIDAIVCDGYTMIADTCPRVDEVRHLYECCTDGIWDFWGCKPAIVSPRADVTYAIGRHAFSRVGPGVRLSRESGVQLLHYRYLGHEYCRQRNAENLSRMSERNIRYKWHKHNTTWSHTVHSLKWYEHYKTEAVNVINGQYASRRKLADRLHDVGG